MRFWTFDKKAFTNCIRRFGAESYQSQGFTPKQKAPSLMEGEKGEAEYMLNPEKLDILLHSAAIFTLLEAKARSLLYSNVPGVTTVDRVIYKQCSADATTAVELSRCVVALMDARDRLKMVQQHRLLNEEKHESTVSYGGFYGSTNINTGIADEGEKDWITTISEWLWPKILTGFQHKRISDVIANMPPPSLTVSIKKSPTKPHTRLRKQQRKTNSTAFNTNSIRDFASRERMKPVDEAQASPQPLRSKLAIKIHKISKKIPGRIIEGDQDETKSLKHQNALNKETILNSNVLKQKFSRNLKQRPIKRAFRSAPEPQTSVRFPNVDKLRRLQKFYETLDYCNNYLSEAGKSNSEFLSLVDDEWDYAFRMKSPEPLPLLTDFERQLENYTFGEIELLSPRFLTLFREGISKGNGVDGHQSMDKKNPKRILSPTLFSLQKGEGLFSLPILFEAITTDETEIHELLELVIELSGSAQILDRLLAELAPKQREIDERLYPLIRRLREFENRWSTLQNSLSQKQKEKLKSSNYIFLKRHQYDVLFGHEKRSKATIVESEDELETSIRRIAELDENLQSRITSILDEPDCYRQAEEEDEPNSLRHAKDGNSCQQRGKRLRRDLVMDENMESVRNASSDDIPILRPFGFTKFRQGATLNNVILDPRAFSNAVLSPKFFQMVVLSPLAFGASVLSPRAMIMPVLSPTAFTANILNPNTLWTEVLSPKFFHANIISPRALASLVLSPRTMLADVLSPKLAEFRVLNPATFFIGVLSPNILMPRVLSPSNFGILVLNPFILSPSVLSPGKFVVKVLSPSIMSDDVSTQELLNGKWEKEKDNTTTTTNAPMF